MIERYDCPEISDIWSERAKFSAYLKVELALAKALEGKLIPKGVAKAIEGGAKIDPERIKEIEATTKHDVVAFCSSVTERLPAEISKYFHYGVTSSDIIDTALALQIKSSLELILKQYKRLLRALEKKANDHKYTVCMGRSHGMNAEPMSFGQKFLSSYAEFYRRYKDLEHFAREELTGQMSGAVGNYTALSREIEQEAIQSLGLRVEPVSTQVVPRDRIAKLLSITALAACAVERLAVEIRHLHHSDIGEVNEGFSKGQKGSSIMPHKKNPVSAENLTGIARVLRSHLIAAQENTVLWHERDISHSSAERLVLPDNLGLFFYALKRLASTVENLVVNKELAQQKVLRNFSHLSSYLLHEILRQADLPREKVYPTIQKAAFEAKDAAEFLEMIKKDSALSGLELPRIDAMGEEAIRKIYLKETDKIYDSVFSSYPPPA